MDQMTKNRIKEVILFSLSHHKNCENHCIKFGHVYLCARCTGIYLGFFTFLLTVIFLYSVFYLNPYLFITAFVVWMPLDIWYDKIGYKSNVTRRFISGFLFGYGSGIMLLLTQLQAYIYLGFISVMGLLMLIVMRTLKGGWYIWAMQDMR